MMSNLCNKEPKYFTKLYDNKNETPDLLLDQYRRNNSHFDSLNKQKVQELLKLEETQKPWLQQLKKNKGRVRAAFSKEYVSTLVHAKEEHEQCLVADQDKTYQLKVCFYNHERKGNKDFNDCRLMADKLYLDCWDKVMPKKYEEFFSAVQLNKQHQYSISK